MKFGLCTCLVLASLISHINGLHCLLFKIWLDLPNTLYDIQRKTTVYNNHCEFIAYIN